MALPDYDHSALPSDTRQLTEHERERSVTSVDLSDRVFGIVMVVIVVSVVAIVLALRL